MKLRMLSSPESNNSIYTYYVHKKFGCITLEKSPPNEPIETSELQEEEQDSKSIEILDVLVLNTNANNSKSLKVPNRKAKAVKIAPYPPKMQQYKSTMSSIISTQQKTVKPSLPHIVTSNSSYLPAYTSQLAYFIQPTSAPSVYATPSSISTHFQRTSTPLGPYPVQQFEPMSYTRLLQLQLNTKSKGPYFLERRQLFTGMHTIPS